MVGSVRLVGPDVLGALGRAERARDLWTRGLRVALETRADALHRDWWDLWYRGDLRRPERPHVGQRRGTSTEWLGRSLAAVRHGDHRADLHGPGPRRDRVGNERLARLVVDTARRP